MPETPKDHCCARCEDEVEAFVAPTIYDYDEVQPFGCNHRVYFFLPTPSAKDRPCYCNGCARARKVCMRCGTSMRAARASAPSARSSFVWKAHDAYMRLLNRVEERWGYTASFLVAIAVGFALSLAVTAIVLALWN